MSEPRAQTSRAPSSPPDHGLVSSTIARLRAEHDAIQSASTRALLLHEIGVLEELLGDEASAARDQLGSVNADPDFREPLERLIAIIERRQSFKNLGKLLERLVRVAEGAEERSRALVERAMFLADHENELTQARETLEQALEDRNEDAAAWLLLEVIAGKLGDADLRAHALSARSELSQHPTWRALLLIDRAAMHAAGGEFDAALSALEQALERPSQATFLALLALEEFGRKAERFEVAARALEGQAGLLVRAIEEPETGDALGVPRYRRSPAHATDSWLRAADLQRRRGDLAAAATLLDRAMERLENQPTLSHARVAVAELSGDTATAARLARSELDRGVKGPLAAALYLRLSEAAASEGDAKGALDALSGALKEDPACIPARALELDLLGGGQDPLALAAALEAAAEQLSSDEAKARFYLLAADAWARLGGDMAGAKAALSQAVQLGIGAGPAARIARLLASFAGDTFWYEEATRRLLAAGASEGEQPGLWFELGRARLLRGDLSGATQAFESLGATAAGAWLGYALRAYALGLIPAAAEGSEAARASAQQALHELSRIETNAATGRALRLVVAARALLAQNVDEALQRLEELHAGDRSDVVSAQMLAALSRANGDAKRSAEVLAQTAAETDDAALAAAFALEAGIGLWQAGERPRAVECFALAREHAPEAGGLMLGWALRAVDPNGLDARRRVLEAQATSSADASLARLERFALEVGRGGDAAAARAALEALERSSASELREAAELARALFDDSDGERAAARAAALKALSLRSRPLAAIAAASAHIQALEHSSAKLDAKLLEATAADWAHTDASPAPAIEWLAFAIAAGDRENEVLAREALAEKLEGEASTAMRASARLVALLNGDESQPLIGGGHVMARLADLELAPPGCDPRRRSAALLGLGDVLGDETTSLSAALAGWNQLAEHDIEGARATFRAVVEAHPEEVIGWEGLRATATLAEDRALAAEACAALGDAVSDDRRGSELWEAAAIVLLDELKDDQRGEFALSRAIERDIGRHAAFDRLFRIVRSRKDGPRLLELISRRLEVAEDPAEIAKLFWERARVLREAGDREGALSALENVTLLEPDHVGALALSGEIYITTGHFDQAAENLARLASLHDAPAKQRLMSGVAAVDLYENKLNDMHRALEVLVGLYRSGLSTLPVRERLARAAARAGAWVQATEVLEQLMHERDTRAGRMEAARLCLALQRDRLGQPEHAGAAVEQLLREMPDDGEALDVVLSNVLPVPLSIPLLERGLDAIAAELQSDPFDAERVDRLARIAGQLRLPRVRQAALGVLVTLGEGSPEIDRELSVLDQRVSHVPQIAIDEAALPELCDPEDSGPIPTLMRELASTFAEVLGPGLAAFGVTKKDRVDPRAGLPVRNEIAAWAGALGIGEFEFYVGGRDGNGVYAIPTDKPAIVVGPLVGAPLSPMHRQMVARELFALRRGATILRHRDSGDIAALVVAACKVAGFDLPAPPYAMLGEFMRALGKEMPRRVRKLLPELTAPIVKLGQDPVLWTQAAAATLDRMAVIAAGDVSWVLSGGSYEARGQFGSSHEAQERARRLLSFVLSPTYLSLRERLGMGVR